MDKITLFDKLSMKKSILKLVYLGYRRIFHEEMSVDVELFLKNLLLVTAATTISTLFVIVFTILGGRKLGPAEYGKYVLIQSVASFLGIPMQLGFATAMLKYVSEKNDLKYQSAIIVTTYTLVLLLSGACTILFLLISPSLSEVFNISPEFIHLAIAFAGLSCLYSLTTSALRGLNMMKAYSLFQVIYGSLILISFLLFTLDKNLTFNAMLYPTFLAYIICTLVIILIYGRKLSMWKFESSLMGTMFKYALFSTMSAISIVLYTNIDKIMISKYLDTEFLGIYNAYYSASINGASVFFNMFITVFFTTVSKYNNKKVIFKRINKFIPYLITLGIPFIIVCEFIVIRLFGNKYTFSWIWVVLASIASIGFVIEGLYIWLLNSVGSAGAKITALGTTGVAIINFGLNLFLIPLANITGALLSIIISLLIGTIFILYYGRNHFNT